MNFSAISHEFFEISMNDYFQLVENEKKRSSKQNIEISIAIQPKKLKTQSNDNIFIFFHHCKHTDFWAHEQILTIEVFEWLPKNGFKTLKVHLKTFIWTNLRDYTRDDAIAYLTTNNINPSTEESKVSTENRKDIDMVVESSGDAPPIYK